LKFPRVVVSAPHRSSGKTTLSIGLNSALTESGKKVQAFKKGPDYIDPMWHTAATGRNCRNLDLFMMGEDNILRSFQKAAYDADISIIEGNMGLYDGMEVDGIGSTADMARLLKSPVVLIIDTSNMTRSIAPLILGFQNFETDVNIAGVILNKVSGPRHESKLRATIERYCDIEVVGSIPRFPEIEILQRHLGLRPAKEDEKATSIIGSISRLIKDHVDLDKIVQIAEKSPILPEVEQVEPVQNQKTVKIGIAQDRAFTFYYPENLEALEAAGAELIPFSPIYDTSLPEVSGLYIGGGFPEVFMEELEANNAIREEIRLATEKGIPVYAECGGLMYLARAITWDGATREMVGAIPGDILMHKKPKGHGYIKLEATGKSWFDVDHEIRGHEFHYSEVVNLDCVDYSYKINRGKGVDGRNDGIVYRNILASYAHLHIFGAPEWAEKFVDFVKQVGFKL